MLLPSVLPGCVLRHPGAGLVVHLGDAGRAAALGDRRVVRGAGLRGRQLVDAHPVQENGTLGVLMRHGTADARDLVPQHVQRFCGCRHDGLTV